MSKDALIAELGAPYFYNKRALAFAKESLSAVQAANSAEVLGKRIKGVSKAFDITSYALGAVGGALWLAYMLKDYTPRSLEAILGSVAVVFFLTLFSMIPLFIARACVLEFWANAEVKELLEPIAGTSQCEDALRHLVQGGEMVSQWRDLAVAERGQLHGFDAEIMRVLHARYDEMTRTAAYKAKQDEACRQVHGIAAADQASETAQPM